MSSSEPQEKVSPEQKRARTVDLLVGPASSPMRDGSVGSCTSADVRLRQAELEDVLVEQRIALDKLARMPERPPCSRLSG